MNRSLWGLALAFFLGGCAGTLPSETPSASTVDGDPVAIMRTEIQAARVLGVAWLSPATFQIAEKLSTQTESAMASGKTEEASATALRAVERVRKAVASAETARFALSDVITAREAASAAVTDARNAGARGVDKLQSALDEAGEYLTKLTKAIELGEVEWADRKKGETAAAYSRVRVEAMKKWSLDRAKRAMETADAEDASTFAPQARTLATARFLAAEKFVGEKPQAREEIEKQGREVEFFANRLLALTRAGKAFSEMQPEEISNWLERNLQGLGASFKLDHRDKPFEEQLKALRTKIEGLSSESRTLAQETEQLSRHKQGLTQEAQRLQSDLDAARTEVKSLSTEVASAKPTLERDRRYEATRTIFNEGEAEVLRDGPRVVLRLRAIQFPVGKAHILPESFPLLAKVQKAIQGYGMPQVTVEGHTDSVGSRKVNEKLSLKRAEAVMEYLVASNAVPRKQVIIAGFGFQRPLTTDKTPEGRAINRRIDVVITPGN